MAGLEDLSGHIERVTDVEPGTQVPEELAELMGIVSRPEGQSIEDCLRARESETPGTIRKAEQLITAILVDAIVDSEVGNLNLTTRIARTLATDTRLNEETVMKVALAVSSQVAPFDQDALLEKVRSGASQAIANCLAQDTGYRAVEGIEQIGTGNEVEVDLGLGYNWKARGSDSFIGSTFIADQTAIVNTISALNVSPDDRRKIVDILMPVVVKEDGEYILKWKDPEGNLEDLYRGEQGGDKSYKLSDIVAPRKTEWGDYPVYSKEDFARYLEAVIQSDIPEADKQEFVRALLKTSEFDESIHYDRPLYAGGGCHRQEHGTRITLPTGQSIKISENDRYGRTTYSLRADSPRQGYSTERTDAIFVMALVEDGRLPREALGSIYDIRISENQVQLRSNHILDSACTIDLSKPFDEEIDFSPMHLSFLLERDPRVSQADRARLKAYFGRNIEPRVIAKQEV